MTNEEFKNLSIHEFKEWLKSACVNNSYYNIEAAKSFRTIVIERDGEEAIYFCIQYRDNIELLFDTLVTYLEQFNSTISIIKLFIYSNNDQLVDFIKTNDKYNKALVFLLDIIEEEEDE